MNNDIFKTLAETMDKIEKESINCIYIVNNEVELKGQNLYYNLVSMGMNTRLIYKPAYKQIVVIAETFVFDIASNNIKNSIMTSDAISIDATLNGLIHMEFVFNNAFRRVGELNE